MLGPRVRFPEGAADLCGSFAPVGVLFGRVLMGARPFLVGAYPCEVW